MPPERKTLSGDFAVSEKLFGRLEDTQGLLQTEVLKIKHTCLILGCLLISRTQCNLKGSPSSQLLYTADGNFLKTSQN
jgi:hypothetical protein